jgi:hypothetical protein
LVRCEEHSENDDALDPGMEAYLQGGGDGRDEDMVVLFGETDSRAIADTKRLKLPLKNIHQVG